MGKYELDKWDLKRLLDLSKKGRINLQPEYQRGNIKVWDDPRRYDLIDTILRDWPCGLIMLRAYEKEGITPSVETYDVVDGQQRLTTLFHYMDGSQAWALKPPKKKRKVTGSFKPFRDLPEGQQTRVEEYKVSVAFMRGYEDNEILDVYQRLQRGKALNIGEKVKAMRTEFKEYLKELTSHKIFNIGQHRFRDSHWNLAAQFFKAVYKNDPLARVDYNQLKEFLEDKCDHSDAQKAKDRTNKILNYENKIFEEATRIDPSFDENLISSDRTFKWLFAVLMRLIGRYTMTGREHLVAEGLLSYYKEKEIQDTSEWKFYMSSGRSGRMDTDDVKICLEQLYAHIVNASDALPTDVNRWFTPQQRNAIWQKSKSKCAKCGMKLSKTNFHADHIKPHTAGGPTSVENGQALCVECNIRKGKDLVFMKA
ncbi:MAG: DUF262 domain-containing protein [Dehalococcoidia bacterium]